VFAEVPMPTRSDTGETVQKPTRSVKQRRFPWRLWLYAIVVTAAAGAGGYYTWHFRQHAKSASAQAAKCQKDAGAHAKQAADQAKQLTDCQTALGAATVKDKQLDAQLADISKNLDASKEELAQLRAQKAEADKRMAAIENIQKQFAKMIDTGQLRVSARHGELVLSLPSEVLFPSGSAELSKQGEYAVVEVAAVLKQFPDRRYLVVGHTDNQDIAKARAGSTAATCTPIDNWQLSTERALTVTRVMVTAGMDSKNLIPAGVGEHDPIASNATPQGRQKNRRIEIALLPAISELPPLPPTLHDDDAPAAPAPKPKK
jgi:chemotaxis protein MotB